MKQIMYVSLLVIFLSQVVQCADSAQMFYISKSNVMVLNPDRFEGYKPTGTASLPDINLTLPNDVSSQGDGVLQKRDHPLNKCRRQLQDVAKSTGGGECINKDDSPGTVAEVADLVTFLAVRGQQRRDSTVTALSDSSGLSKSGNLDEVVGLLSVSNKDQQESGASSSQRSVASDKSHDQEKAQGEVSDGK